MFTLQYLILTAESPPARGAGGLDFSAIGGEKQRHGSALTGAGVTVEARAKHPVWKHPIRLAGMTIMIASSGSAAVLNLSELI